jgi:DNA-binding MarR family transcriptional regulator
VLGLLSRRLRADYTLSLSQGAVLGRLEREGPTTASALAVGERVRPQSMAQTIHDLEAEGLISRRVDQADRRQVLVELTAAGHAALDDERRRREGWLARAIADSLTADERATIVRAIALLERISAVDLNDPNG